MGGAVVIGVGVLGAGIMGADHARLLSSVVAGATVTATFDIDVERARAVAALSSHARVFDDPLAMIADDSVDAVLIASSDATHEQFVLAAIAAGKPVLCEKPLASTVEACERIVAAEAQGGRRLVTVGFMRRHDPGYVALRTGLTNGSLGAPLMVHNVHRNVHAGPDQPTEFLITGSAVHELDILRWLLNEEIVAVTVHRPRSAGAAGTTSDPLFLVLETASGVLADVEVFVNAAYGYEVRCELVGETGTLTLDTPAAVIRRSALSTSRSIAADWRPRFAEAYRLELQEWIDAITVGRVAHAASAWDGYVATLVAQAAVAALNSGERTAIAVAQPPLLYR